MKHSDKLHLIKNAGVDTSTLLALLALAGTGGLAYTARDTPMMKDILNNLGIGPTSKKTTSGWANAGNYLGSQALHTGAQFGYQKGLLPRIFTVPASESFERYLAGTATNADQWNKLKEIANKSAPIEFVKRPLQLFDMGGAYYVPAAGAQSIGMTGNNVLLKGDHGLAMAAHEVGHHQGMTKYPRLLNRFAGIPSSIGHSIAPLYTSYTDDSTNGLISALAGTALTTPQLLSEFDASRRGGNIMKEITGKHSMKPYGGLPTYLLQASTPLLTHLGKKSLGLYEDEDL